MIGKWRVRPTIQLKLRRMMMLMAFVGAGIVTVGHDLAGPDGPLSVRPKHDVQSLDLSSREPAMLRLSPRLEETLREGLREARIEAELAAPPSGPLRLSDFSRVHKFHRGQLTRTPLESIVDEPDQAAASPEFLPTHLNAGDDFSRTVSKILDHNLQNYLRGEAFRHSEFGQMTKQIERSLRAGLSWGGRSQRSSPTSSPASASGSALSPVRTQLPSNASATSATPPATGTQHRLEVGLLAAQAQAKMTYSGFTDAELIYSAANQQLEWALREPLRENLNLVYNHTETRVERRDSLSLHLSW